MPSLLLERTTQKMKRLSKEILDWANDTDEVELDDSVEIRQPSLLLSVPEYDDEPTNQMEVVKKLLVTYGNKGVCHRDFMENYIARFGALIWILRHENNWVIDKEWCEDKSHNHKTQQYRYVLRGKRDDI